MRIWLGGALLTAACAGFAAAVLHGLPDVAVLRTQNPPTTAFMGWQRSRAGASAADVRPLQVWVPLEDISPNLVRAVILSEDDTFYQHHGFDLEQIREAVRRDWFKGRYVYGGSTLTQQLARNLYLSPEKTLLRKAREAVIAWKLERRLTKHRILELYMNVAEWGPGVYGAEAAARVYFGKHASELTPEEAVALAAALPSPRRFNPLQDSKHLARRRGELLERFKQTSRASFGSAALARGPVPAGIFR